MESEIILEWAIRKNLALYCQKKAKMVKSFSLCSVLARLFLGQTHSNFMKFFCFVLFLHVESYGWLSFFTLESASFTLTYV